MMEEKVIDSTPEQVVAELDFEEVWLTDENGYAMVKKVY